ncbi:MAG: class I SAM-dependent methyltransferase [Bacteroidia bacterium]
MNTIKYYKLLRRIYYFLYKLSDQIKGVDFSALDSSMSDQAHGVHYTPSVSKGVRIILKKLNISESDSIIDIGCGKGKAISLFRKFTFAKNDGVEIANELVEVAKKNILKLKIENSEIFCADAIEFDKYADYNYFYIFNSLPPALFEKVFLKIKSSNPQNKKYIITLNLTYRNIILENNEFILLHTHKSIYKGFDVECYMSK